MRDSWSIRNSALQGRVTYYTTVSGARAACLGMQHLEELRPYDLQGLHATLPVGGQSGHGQDFRSPASARSC